MLFGSCLALAGVTQCDDPTANCHSRSKTTQNFTLLIGTKSAPHLQCMWEAVRWSHDPCHRLCKPGGLSKMQHQAAAQCERESVGFTSIRICTGQICVREGPKACLLCIPDTDACIVGKSSSCAREGEVHLAPEQLLRVACQQYRRQLHSPYGQQPPAAWDSTDQITDMHTYLHMHTGALSHPQHPSIHTHTCQKGKGTGLTERASQPQTPP